MITKEATYKKAFENKLNRVKAKKQQRELLLNSAYTAEPKLKDIERQLSEIGASIAMTALSGNTKKLELLKAQSTELTHQKAELLQKHGVPKITYECDICNDSGYVSGKICECIKKEAKPLCQTSFQSRCRWEIADLITLI